MSDSILYLAIVGIWAGFLIPAWVRRPHGARVSSELSEYEGGVPVDDLVSDDVFGDDVLGDEAYSEAVYPETDAVGNVAFEMDTGPYIDMHAANSEYRDDVHMHSYGPGSTGSSGSGGSAGSYDGRPAPGPMPPASAPESSTPRSSTPRSSTPRPAQGPVPSGQPAPSGLSGPRQPSQSREQMMRARRRMLTILVSLVLITALFVLSGLVQWWICVPPIAMLALYVALLREIAVADAELAAKKRAWEARQAAQAAEDADAEAGDRSQQTGWKQSHQVWEAAETRRMEAEAEAGPSAQIIDISSRVGDQLYDQYADAAVRAVGD